MLERHDDEASIDEWTDGSLNTEQRVSCSDMLSALAIG